MKAIRECITDVICPLVVLLLAGLVAYDHVATAGLPVADPPPAAVLLLTAGRGHSYRVYGVFSGPEPLERARKRIQASWAAYSDTPIEWNPAVEMVLDRPWEPNTLNAPR